MIDPSRSWFEIVELPVMELVPTDTVNKDRKFKEAYFDKSSRMICNLVNKSLTDTVKNKDRKTKKEYFEKSLLMISNLVNKCWFSRYPHCQHIIYHKGSEFKLHFKTLCDTYRVKRKPTTLKTHKQMHYWNRYITS